MNPLQRKLADARYKEIVSAFDTKRAIKEDGVTVLIRLGNLMLAGICEDTQTRKDAFRDAPINMAMERETVDSVLGQPDKAWIYKA